MTELIEVYRTPHERSCLDRGLVLASQGLPFARVQREGFHVLLVDERFVARAAEELRRFEEENRGFRLRSVLPPAAPFAGGASAAFALVLLVLGLAQWRSLFGLDWVEHGVAHAALLRQGELWRAATALTLHTDLAHLLGNVFFALCFGYLVAHGLGGGLGYLAILVAGILGNWTNAWVQAPGHLSIGASTAVFGAVGILCGSEARRRHLLMEPRARRFAPIGAALVFLLYLGLGQTERLGEIDVLAHVFGLLWGLLIGFALPNLLARGFLRRGPQIACAGAASALLALAWMLAFDRI